jgi:hypothetical protein
MSEANDVNALVMREWCYCQKPEVYEIYCDICGGTNTTWSEYERHIWCYDCEKDTRGTGGVFDGPISVELCKTMGISFDRIRLADGKLLKMSIEDEKIVYA